MIRLTAPTFAAIQGTVKGKRVVVKVDRSGLSAHIHDGDTEHLTKGKSPDGMREWLRRFGVDMDELKQD